MGRAGEQIELYITDISTQGEGIGKAGGLAVFASGALPGDTVLVKASHSMQFEKITAFLREHFR